MNTIDQLFIELLKREVKDFPLILLENIDDVAWESGKMYTFEPSKSTLIVYRGLIINHVLKLYEVDIDGQKKYIKDVNFSLYKQEGELYESVLKYTKMPEFNGNKISQSISEAVKEVIEDFGNGTAYKGCYFVSNKEILTVEAMVGEFMYLFEKEFSNFYIELMANTTYEEGSYYVDINRVKISQEEIYNVETVVRVFNKETNKIKEVMLDFPVKVPKSKLNPKKAELLKIVNIIIKKFKEKKPKYSELGLEFSFYENKEVNKEESRFNKIKGDPEEFKRWSERVQEMLNKNPEMVKQELKSVKNRGGLIKMVFKDNKTIVLGVGGILSNEGLEIYIKKEMNLQEGFISLSKNIGKKPITLKIISTYDYRRVVEGERKNEDT